MLLAVLVIYYHLRSYTLKSIVLLNIVILVFFRIPLFAIFKYSKRSLPILLIRPIITILWWSYYSLKEGVLENNISVFNPCIYSNNISTYCHTKSHSVMLPQTGFQISIYLSLLACFWKQSFQLLDYLDSQNILLKIRYSGSKHDTSY